MSSEWLIFEAQQGLSVPDFPSFLKMRVFLKKFALLFALSVHLTLERFIANIVRFSSALIFFPVASSRLIA